MLSNYFNLCPCLCIGKETKTKIQKEEELLRKGEVEQEKEIIICDSKKKKKKKKKMEAKRAGDRKRTM